MLKNRRSLVASSVTSSGIGFVKSESQLKLRQPESKDSQGYKKYAPILVLEMNQNNEYEFKDSSFQNELNKKER